MNEFIYYLNLIRLSKLVHQASHEQESSNDNNTATSIKPPLPSNYQRPDVASASSISTTTTTSTTKSSQHRTS